MRCGTRTLSLVSLGFGLVATGALSLAVATDYWLFTIEPLPTQQDYGPGRENFTEEESVTTPQQDNYIVIHAHSGLWRTCIILHEISVDEGVPPKSCSSIAYFEQSSERVDGADTTMSILRAIRKSSPVIVGSLLLLLTALTLSIVGTTKNDFKIIVSAIIYIFSALSLGMGVILYISAVNDEVAHRKKQSDSGPDGRTTFSYRYGWAFFFGGATFVCAMAAAVSNISLYLRRYSHFDDTLLIVPASSSSACGPADGPIDVATASAAGGGPTGYRPVRRGETMDESCGRYKVNRASMSLSRGWYNDTKPSDRPLHPPNHNLTIPL
jgi:hypothetical protein